MVTLLVCLCLAVAFNAPLTEAANPTVPENPAKAPWYFVGLQELVSYSAFTGGMAIPGVLIVCMVFLPYIDRQKEELGVYFGGKSGKTVALQSVLFSVVGTVVSVAIPVKFGWLRNWFPEISQLLIIAVNPGTLLILSYLLWMTVIYKKTGSHNLKTAYEIANYHHEHFNGNGYPEGLKGDDIPVAARIMTLADIYDALTSERSYKKAYSHNESRKLIVLEYGNQLDPLVVDAFLRQEETWQTVRQRFID